MARPAYRPTPEQRLSVEQMVSCGVSQDTIARALDINRETLAKHFKDELETGGARRRQEIVDLMYAQARKGNVTAIKRLEEMTQPVEAGASFEKRGEAPALEEKPVKPPKLGKKEQAAVTAGTAGAGTEWGDDLKVPATGLN